jgi:hypothetical protein
LERFRPVPLDGTSGQANEGADLAVRQIQNTVQDQNTLLCAGQLGKDFGHKLVVDPQLTAIRRKHSAVTGVMIDLSELVYVCLG